MSDRARLYETADALYKLAPWKWMNETQVIGLRHPETGELARLSLMGSAGEHTSLAIYLGEEALHRFNLMQHAAGEGIELTQEDGAALILDSRQVQASFTVRDELFKSERGEIKTLGRKYRGANWPCFRSFRPGRAPGPVNAEEAVWLQHGMEQLMAVAPLLDSDPFAHYRAGENGTEILTRERNDGVWRTVWTPDDERLFSFPSPEPSELLTAKVARHTRKADVECHFALIPNPVGPSPAERVYPYMVISVESSGGFVLGMEMLSVDEHPYEELIASTPDHFLRQWDAHSIRPASISVASEATRALLAPAAKALSVPLHVRHHLPALDACMSSLSSFMGGGGLF
ncbi:MAG: hypothetical protein V4726_20420 [Verrucomicrobiota bacterium]